MFLKIFMVKLVRVWEFYSITYLQYSVFHLQKYEWAIRLLRNTSHSATSCPVVEFLTTLFSNTLSQTWSLDRPFSQYRKPDPATSFGLIMCIWSLSWWIAWLIMGSILERVVLFQFIVIINPKDVAGSGLQYCEKGLSRDQVWDKVFEKKKQRSH